ncbi:MAG: hypothetical protein ABI970_08045 [Chloroflexota bacterium]
MSIRKAKPAFYSLFAVIPLCGALLSFIFGGAGVSKAQTVKTLVAAPNCDAPCLFGQSLNGATYSQVRELLETSSWTKGAEITFDAGNISWRWPEAAVHQVVSPEYPGLSQFRDVNYIDFQNGIVQKIVIVFSLPIKDIIAEFGDDFDVYPFAYYGRFTTYALVYRSLGGEIFEAMVDCQNPQITPDTLVMNYYYRYGLSSEIATKNPIRWQGYTTQLPDCSAFQPQ